MRVDVIMSELLVKLAILTFGGYVLWSVLRPKHPIRIVVDQTGVRQHRGLPKAQAKKVVSFLDRQTRPAKKLVIYVARLPNGYLLTDFRGPSDSEWRQRVRNFLVDVL